MWPLIKSILMKIIRGVNRLSSLHRGGVLTIGNFDGLHLGHQNLLRMLTENAKKQNAPSIILMCEPTLAQKSIRYADALSARLNTFKDKMQQLATWGFDFVICQPFVDTFKQLTAKAFIQDILIEKMAIKALIVGDDFRFGCDRLGNYELLMDYHRLNKFFIQRSPSVLHYNERISSTRIRMALKISDFKTVSTLLGRPYRLIGRVVLGCQMGRTLGMPTANLNIKSHDIPIRGVFVAYAYYLSKRYAAVVNVGFRPTLAAKGKLSVEAHLLDFQGDLYHQTLQLEFLCKLRDEQTFTSVNELKETIQQDINNAKQYLESTLVHSTQSCVKL